MKKQYQITLVVESELESVGEHVAHAIDTYPKLHVISDTTEVEEIVDGGEAE